MSYLTLRYNLQYNVNSILSIHIKQEDVDSKSLDRKRKRIEDFGTHFAPSGQRTSKPLDISRDPVHFVLPWYTVPKLKLVIMGSHAHFK